MNYELKIKAKIIGFILCFVFLVGSSSVFAAESRIYFKGPAGDLAPGSEILVSVLLDSVDPINAFDLEISYPKDKLEFLNFDNTDSVVNIWQPAPTILSNGNLGLSGGIIKAFSGKGGLLIKLSFQVLSSGSPKLSFVKNNLYIADGKGTQVKAAMGTFSFSIKEEAKIVSSPSSPFKPTPENILIEKELEKFKSEIFWKKMLTPLVVLLVVIFGISALAVYNKRKRKL